MYRIAGASSGNANPDQGTIDPSKMPSARFDDLARMANSQRGRYRQRVDAKDVSFYVEQELEQMEAEVRRTVRTPLSAFDHIPMRTGTINPGARTVAYKQITSSGKAGWLGSKGSDLNRVSVGAKKFDAPARMFGLAYGWDFEDILEGLFTGSSLPNEEAIAARRANDEFLNSVAWHGNLPDDPEQKEAEEDWYGLLNFPGIKSPKETVKISKDSTPTQILAMLRSYANDIREKSGGVEMATRLILPIAAYDYIQETEISDDNDTTILERFTGRNPEISVVRAPELKGASAAGDDVMVFLDPQPDKLVLDISLLMLMLMLQQRGFEFIQPIVSKVVRLRVFRPEGIRVVSGI